jgi:hypothetical protein
VFNVNKLRLAATDPLPSQPQDDTEPEPIEVDGEEEYLVEEILEERKRRKRKEYLTKWLGYQEPTWEPQEHLENTEALEIWERHKRGGTVKG